MPKTTGCKEKYDIYGFDEHKNQIWKKLKYGFQEFQDCLFQNLFDRIKYVKVRVRSWNKEIGEMSDFVNVKEEGTRPSEY